MSKPKRISDANVVDVGPVRMCVICRRRFPKVALKRYVLTQEGILLVDREQKSPGRGWYVCSEPGCEGKFAKFKPGTRRKKGKICQKNASD